MSLSKPGNEEMPIEQMSYEQAFSALEEIVEALETDRQSLEDSMRLFERGQLLARHCMRLLDQAELRVKQLAGDELTDFSPEN